VSCLEYCTSSSLFLGHSVVGRTLASAGELSLSCTRLLAGTGSLTTLWLSRPLSVSQRGQLSLPSLWDRLMSNSPCYSGLRRQTAEGVVRGVAYCPRQRVLLAARLECRLAAGSRLRNGDERCSLALWAVREPTSHWGLCLSFVCLGLFSVMSKSPRCYNVVILVLE